MRSHGFTLAELLIALAVLGVIATFTIPKILVPKKMEDRYSKAQETLAALSQVTSNYAFDNGGCFTGLSCRLDGSGNALDGKPTGSGCAGGANCNYFLAYLDTHLNYVNKTVAGETYYYLPNGVVVVPWIIRSEGSSTYPDDMLVEWGVFIDRNLTQVLANQYSSRGVDTHYADVFTSLKGRALGGWDKIFPPYNHGSHATIYHYKDYPGETCTVVGGSNCGI